MSAETLKIFYLILAIKHNLKISSNDNLTKPEN